jgi:hypothetical protein
VVNPLLIGAGAFYSSWVVVNWMISKEKNRDGWSIVVASIFVTPLLVWFYLVAVPPIPRSEQ